MMNRNIMRLWLMSVCLLFVPLLAAERAAACDVWISSAQDQHFIALRTDVDDHDHDVIVHISASGTDSEKTNKIKVHFNHAKLDVYQLVIGVGFVAIANDSEYDAPESPAELTFYAQGEAVSDTVDDAPITATLTVDGVTADTDTLNLTVIDVQLGAYTRGGTAISEDDEDDPGAFVAYNNDDDDADSGGTQMDKDDNDIRKDGTGKEDDTIKVVCTLAGAAFDNLQTGKVVLKRANTKLKLWKKQSKEGASNEIVFDQAGNTEKVYDLSVAGDRTAFANDVKSKDLWLEGYEASTALRDTGLTLIFRDPSSTEIDDDQVNVTVIELALQMYKRNGTTLIGLDAKADPGSFILYNNDDDDTDGTMDLSDSDIGGEDDSARARLAFGALFSGLQKGRVTLQRTNDKVKVWKAAAKGTGSELTFTTNKRFYNLEDEAGRTAFTNEVLNKDVFVEGCTVSGGVRDTGLTLIYDKAANDVAVNGVAITVMMIDLKEISFSGDKYHEIKKDDSSIDFAAPHWKDNSTPRDKDANDAGDVKYPVCFTRDTFMKISAKVEIGPAAAFPAAPKLKADHTGNYDFADDGTKSGTEVAIVGVQCANKLANNVAYVNPLELAWSMSIDGGTEWFEFGKTKNVLYVTLGDPVTIPATTLWETPLKIGCEKADGQNADIVDEIWSEFTDLDVKRVDGVQLIYWKTDDPNQTLEGLLANTDGDGSCIAFAQLLHWCLKSQGIATSHVFTITPDAAVNANVEGLLVKNWKFDRHIHTGADGKRNSAKVGDDDPTCDVGHGFPNTTAITAGTNLVTTAGVGDAKVGNTITTGGDGVCNTTPDGNDIPRIEVGKGQPDEVCITAGTDGIRQTPKGGDDEIVGNTITTGDNGICESTKVPDDQDPIPIGTGLPNTVCIEAGINLVTAAAVGDAVDGDTISSGADGLRDTDPDGNDVPVILVKGNGKPNMPCLLPGPDGVLNSTKAGDDDYADGVFAGQPYPYLVDADARDQDGAGAQDNANPPRIFQNHWLCKIGGKVYDPSYGIGDKTELEYEDASMDGYLGPDGTCKKNAAADELDFTEDAARE